MHDLPYLRPYPRRPFWSLIVPDESATDEEPSLRPFHIRQEAGRLGIDSVLLRLGPTWRINGWNRVRGDVPGLVGGLMLATVRGLTTAGVLLKSVFEEWPILMLTAVRELTSAGVLFDSALKEWPVLVLIDRGTALLVVRFEGKHSGLIGISDNFLDPLDWDPPLGIFKRGFEVLNWYDEDVALPSRPGKEEVTQKQSR